MRSYFKMYRNYANFQGFLTRGSYWTGMIIHYILLFAPYCLLYLENERWYNETNQLYYICVGMLLYRVISFIPTLAATIRRLHSLPKSGWFVLIGLIPLVGSIILLIFLLKKGLYAELNQRLDLVNDAFPELFDEETRKFSNNLAYVLEMAKRPRKGGWFWAGLVITAALGYYLLWMVPKNLDFRDLLKGTDNFSFPTVTVAKATAIPTQKTLEPPAALSNANAPAEEMNTMTEIAAQPDEDQVAEVQETGTAAMLPFAQKMTAVPEGAEVEETLPEVSDLLPVEAGTLLMAAKDSMPLISLDGQTFMDQYAVTNSQYTACVYDGDCTPAVVPGWFKNVGSKVKTHPVVWVTHEQAAIYCGWTGRRLPTETEWELAAQNEDAAADYPWGNDFDGDRLNYAGSGLKASVPVSDFSEGESQAGMRQMLGNVWEWTDDETEDEVFALRGGAWNSYQDSLSIESRLEARGSYSSDNLGFRCAVSASALDEELFRLPNEVELAGDTLSGLTFPGDSAKDTLRVKDGAERVFIPAASFSMGLANGAIDEKPVHEVNLSDYWIDLHEVTNAQYAMCVDAGACTEPQQTKSLKRAEYYGNAEFDDYPVIMVSWQQAEKFCNWVDGRLPTEAEWEYAARGDEGSLYPWGADFEAGKLNFSGSGLNDTSPVFDFADDISSLGVMGMGGNVSEWVADRYQENWYTLTNQADDPSGPANGAFRVIRGGSWQTGQNNARTVDRFFAQETSASLDRGFRCAGD